MYDRQFNGKGYVLKDACISKNIANEHAKTLRKRGYLVRVIPKKKNGRIYLYELYVF